MGFCGSDQGFLDLKAVSPLISIIMSGETKGRNWIGTLNNPSVDPEEYLLMWKDKAEYVCGQLEEGKEGTRHI